MTEQIPLAENPYQSKNEELFAQLQHDPRFEVRPVGQEPAIYDISQSMTEGTINRQLAVEQDLQGVIRAGTELFGVVKATVGDDSAPRESFLLTRIATDEQRAEIIGKISSQEPLVIGRKHQTHLNRHTSGNHFAVQLSERGDLILNDLHSTNGTEFISKMRGASQAWGSQSSPLEDFKTWSAKSELVKQLAAEGSIPNQELSPSKLKLLEQIKQKGSHNFTVEAGGESYPISGSEVSGKFIEKVEEVLAKVPDDALPYISEIVNQHSLIGHKIPDILGKWGSGDHEQKLGHFLDLFSENPEAAQLIVEKQIGGFHGTQSGALLGVLQHGSLLSAAEARRRGQRIGTGERYFSSEKGQSSISFADWRSPKSIARYSGSKADPITPEFLESEYKAELEASEKSRLNFGEDSRGARMHLQIAQDFKNQLDFVRSNPDAEETSLILENFPVAFGVSLEGFDIAESWNTLSEDANVNNTIIARSPSDINGEFNVAGSEVPLDRMPVVAVPKQHIKQVEKLFDRYGKKVNVIDITAVTKPRFRELQPATW